GDDEVAEVQLDRRLFLALAHGLGRRDRPALERGPYRVEHARLAVPVLATDDDEVAVRVNLDDAEPLVVLGAQLNDAHQFLSLVMVRMPVATSVPAGRKEPA